MLSYIDMKHHINLNSKELMSNHIRHMSPQKLFSYVNYCDLCGLKIWDFGF